MKRNFTLGLGLLVALTSLGVQATSISGYFDMELIKAKDTTPKFRQHHMNLMIEHEVDKFKFFTEIEFEDVTDHDVPIRANGAVVNGGGRLVVERGYASYNYNKHFHLRMGAMLHDSVFYQNHYPSIAVYTGKQMTRNTIFNRSQVGLRVTGELLMGLYYGAWQSKENDSTAKEGDGVKLGWEGSFAGVDLNAAFQTAKYHNTNTVQDAQGFEVEAEMSNFTLWFEYGTRTAKDVFYDAAKKYKAKATTMDMLVSYSMDMGDKGELVPFFMYGTHKGSGFQAGDATAGTYFTSALNETTFGVNYRPVPSITWKAQYTSTGSADYVDSSNTQGTITANNAITLAFVYFYN